MKKVFFLLLSNFIGFAIFSQKQTVKFTREEDLVLQTEAGALYGTLSIPDSKDSSSILAILISGSGPTDRNGNSANRFYPNTHKLLSRALNKYGISTFRFDKRGVGESFMSIADASKITFLNYLNDIHEWVTLFAKQKKYKHIILLGHSEGGIIAIKESQQNLVSATVLLSTPGFPIDSILVTQLKNKMPSQLENAKQILASLRKGQTVSTVNPSLSFLFHSNNQPFLISLIQIDPATEIQKVNIPVLILQGDKDQQVSVEDAQKLKQANPRSELIILSGMTHSLKHTSNSVNSNITDQANDIMPEITSSIIEFLKKEKLY